MPENTESWLLSNGKCFFFFLSIKLTCKHTIHIMICCNYEKCFYFVWFIRPSFIFFFLVENVNSMEIVSFFKLQKKMFIENRWQCFTRHPNRTRQICETKIKFPVNRLIGNSFLFFAFRKFWKKRKIEKKENIYLRGTKGTVLNGLSITQTPNMNGNNDNKRNFRARWSMRCKSFFFGHVNFDWFWKNFDFSFDFLILFIFFFHHQFFCCIEMANQVKTALT